MKGTMRRRAPFGDPTFGILPELRALPVFRASLRVPTKPAMHSNLKPAGYSDRKPATLGVNRMGRFDDVVGG